MKPPQNIVKAHEAGKPVLSAQHAGNPVLIKGAGDVSPTTEDKKRPVPISGILKHGTASASSIPFSIAMPFVDPTGTGTVSGTGTSESNDAGWESDEARALGEAEARFRQELDAERNRAYDQGVADGKAAAEVEISQLRDRVTALEQHVTSGWEGFLADAEYSLAEFAIQIAEQVLSWPLPEDHARRLRQIMVDTVFQLAEDGKTEVHMHSVDFLALKENGIVDQVNSEHARVFWHPDSELKPGEWVVSTPQAAMRRILSEIIQDVREQSGLDSADS